MRQLFKRIYHAVMPSKRIILLDYPADPKPLYTRERPHKKLFDIISSRDEAYARLLHGLFQCEKEFLTIKETKEETDEMQPAWNNGYVPGLDMMVLYSMVRSLRPSSYIEIGSGTTTKIVNKARKDQSLDLTITCIDPSPRAEITKIADRWIPQGIQQLHPQIFLELKKNDIVFFDGTHTLLPNSDVAWFFLEILPVLPPGVVVQVHDIYLPYDYPQFMLDRYYSENYLLAALIINNPDKFEILAPNYYISENPELASLLDPLWQQPSMTNVEKHGGSFWFRIR
jgi:hypothetical protein